MNLTTKKAGFLDMPSTILVVGATGNTGQSVVRGLSNSLTNDAAVPGFQILALTRSATSLAAQQLASLPGVKIAEYNWVEITAAWLRDNRVAKAFIAPHNQPDQFAEESSFHLAALRAGVQYVVRISTTAANVRPDCNAYYPRSHWAIEAMLSSPEFKELNWTSLQPNIFSNFWLAPAADFIKEYRLSAAQRTLRLMASSDAPVAIVDPSDVGALAARLLSLEDHSPHNNAKYVINGPKNITGKEVVSLVEQYIGERVKDVVFKDVSFVDGMAARSQASKNVILSIKHAPETAWEGLCTASTTSKAVFQLAPPKRTPADVLKLLLGD